MLREVKGDNYESAQRLNAMAIYLIPTPLESLSYHRRWGGQGNAHRANPPHLLLWRSTTLHGIICQLAMLVDLARVVKKPSRSVTGVDGRSWGRVGKYRFRPRSSAAGVDQCTFR